MLRVKAVCRKPTDTVSTLIATRVIDSFIIFLIFSDVSWHQNSLHFLLHHFFFFSTTIYSCLQLFGILTWLFVEKSCLFGVFGGSLN